MWPVGPCLADADAGFAAGVVPAVFEAGAVVGEDALDWDRVSAVEAVRGGEEGGRRGGGLVRVELGESEASRVVDRDEEVLPASKTLCALGAVAGDPVAGTAAAAGLLEVDV